MFSLLQVTDFASIVVLIHVLYRLTCAGGLDHPNSPPVVRTYIPWLGGAVSFMLRRTTFLDRCRSLRGPVFKFFMAGRFVVVVSSPRTITTVVEATAKALLPPEEKTFEILAGLTERVPYVIDLLHRTAYVFVSNGLTKRSMGSVTIRMNKNLFSRLQDVVSVQGEEKSLSIEDFVGPNLYRASSGSFFGTTQVPDTFQDFAALDRSMTFGMFVFSKQLEFLSPSAYRARDRLAKSLETFVEKAWTGGDADYYEDTSAIISDSLRELHNGGLSVEEVSRLLVAVLWGFNSNLVQVTVNALAFMLSDPSVYHRVVAEVRSAIDEKYHDFDTLLGSEPEALDCDEFRILDSIVQETLRITSLASTIREAQCDITLKDDNGSTYFIHKGEMIVADVRGMHLDSRLFPDPNKFIADRFMGSKEPYRMRGVRTLRPWGGGPFICKGREYAHYTIKMFLLQTIHLFDIVPGEYKPSLEVNHSMTVARLRGSPSIRLRRSPGRS